MNTLWHAASNGSGRMHWYVVRDRDVAGRGTVEVAETETGKYRRFSSCETASSAATQLNRKAS